MEPAAFAMPVDDMGTAAAAALPDSDDSDADASSSDCAILAEPACKRARTSSSRDSGPMLCAVIVSSPYGRWSSELSGNDSALRIALREENIHLDIPSASASGATASANAASGIGSFACHGVVALKSWEFLDCSDNAVVTAMVESLRRTHRRSKTIRFLRHRFIHAAALEDPHAIGQG